MKITRLFVVTLWAQDVETTAHFYRDVLCLPMLQHGSRPHFKVGETLITILKSELPISQVGQSLRFPAVAFEVENLDESVQRLKDHKVELPWGIEEDKDGRWVMFKDPAGNLLELAELRS
jgi:catechol 2,3-dioxygenase-like lactoylglutathione lyase family enzyme